MRKKCDSQAHPPRSRLISKFNDDDEEFLDKRLKEYFDIINGKDDRTNSRMSSFKRYQLSMGGPRGVPGTLMSNKYENFLEGLKIERIDRIRTHK